MNKKQYILDTNILLDNEKCIEILRNGEENEIFIPATVIEELDKLKRNESKRHKVARVVSELEKNRDYITILYNGINHDSPDNQILKEIHANLGNLDEPVFVTNDTLLRFKSQKKEIKSEPFKDSNPFQSESQIFTGFVDVENGEMLEKNAFYWKDGKLFFNNRYGEEEFVNINDIWKIDPRTPYQKAAMSLILRDDIDLVSIQSEAGFGKSIISLACMFHLVFQKKQYKKILIFRPNHEIGQQLGFLPGSIEEKMYPYFRPMRDLMIKLHEFRPANRIWKDPEAMELELNPRVVEMLPINYIRGLNVEDSIVLIDECQNLSRDELRTVLSRMGENTKVIAVGDVRQIDNLHLNSDNNGLNWIVKLFRGAHNYGHVVLKGNKSRGPIADLVREVGL
ncbi:MAG TPA: PhoH family protein [Bacteroidales bacterium]|nr:PhoH family protein [Bacteroidales bacterium]